MPGGGPAGWLEPDRSPPTMMDWLRKLRDDLRAHRQSFAISLLATVLGLGLYGYTYLAEAKTWLPQLIDSVELKTYDARFKIRGQVRSSPDIVIVAIDQKTLDDLGAWPFSRVHYARMLENLKKDGAAVVGFDISFPKPDDKSGLTLVQAARAAYLRQTPPDRRDPAYLARLEEMERQADTDAQFADSLRRAGKVVLGQLFFFNREDVTHLDEERQKAYEDVLSFGAYTQVRGLPRADGTVPPPPAETYTGLEALLPPHQPGHPVQAGLLSLARHPGAAPLPRRPRPGVRPVLQRGGGGAHPVRPAARPYRPGGADADQLPGPRADLQAHLFLGRRGGALRTRHLQGENRVRGADGLRHRRPAPGAAANGGLPWGRDSRQRARHPDQPALHPPRPARGDG